MESEGQAAFVAPTAPAISSDEVMRHAPEGEAVIDAEARFVHANPAAVLLCGLDPDAVAGVPSPFPAPDDAAAVSRVGELTVTWEPVPGQRREFAYVLAPVPGRPRWVVSFRDVTLSRLRERRLAAIAKAASSVASKRSLVGTLEALPRRWRAPTRSPASRS